MVKTYRIKDALDSLTADVWRDQTPFSEDMAKVHEILFKPFASEVAQTKALGLWLQKFQPCLFGRIAAATNNLDYCILDEADLREDDKTIGEIVREARVKWKLRSLDPKWTQPAHGFVLFVVSPRITFAAPDANLKKLASLIRELWGISPEKDGVNDFLRETLYLKKPDSQAYVRFTFTVDYFGAQGDGRWWHDHRVPGGMAFTANSVGHMARYREWYEKKGEQLGWVLNTAMLTIDAAAETKHGQNPQSGGKASRLEDLVDGVTPFFSNVTCPLRDEKEELKGKDWTRYTGWHHSDHNVREEFFQTGPGLPDEVLARGRWNQDFAYLIDGSVTEHMRFVLGEQCTGEEIDQKVGKREEARTVADRKQRRVLRAAESTVTELELMQAAEEIDTLLAAIEGWRLPEAEIARLAGNRPT